MLTVVVVPVTVKLPWIVKSLVTVAECSVEVALVVIPETNIGLSLSVFTPSMVWEPKVRTTVLSTLNAVITSLSAPIALWVRLIPGVVACNAIDCT